MNFPDSADWREKLLKASGFSDEEMQQARTERKEDDYTADKKAAASKKDKLNIFVEKKGRGGKIATIIVGFTCSDAELREMASRLKNALGCGGSCRDGEILLQGSRRDEVIPHLRSLGYRI